MSAPAIIATGLTRRIEGRTIVDRADLTLTPGRTVALLGSSGAGKSTLLRLIAGLEPADAGRIVCGDAVLTDGPRGLPPERRQIGVVFQDLALFPHMTAADNIAFGLGGRAAGARAQAVQHWLDLIGLGGRGRALPHELSGGEQQRIALARALAPEPRAVLLDEPFASLDPALRGALRDAAFALLRGRGAAVLFVTHDPDEALAVADVIAVMARGRIVQSGSPEDVYAAPATPDAAAALGPVSLWQGAAAGGRLETPFGPLPAPFDGPATLAVRPEALVLTPDPAGCARVVSRRGAGADRLIEIAPADADAPVWRARALAASAPAPGTRVAVAFAPGGAHLFRTAAAEGSAPAR
jgi:iron(III) transport system ATP-binding protein